MTHPFVVLRNQVCVMYVIIGQMERWGISSASEYTRLHVLLTSNDKHMLWELRYPIDQALVIHRGTRL